MVDIAMRINEIKRQHEQALRAQQFYSRLCSSDTVDLVALGDLILEDVLRVGGGWADKHFHVFLFRNALLMTKKRKDGLHHVKNIIKVGQEHYQGRSAHYQGRSVSRTLSRSALSID